MGAALRRSFVWTAILALFFDQLTKMLVYGMTGGVEGAAPIRIIGEVLKLSYTTNLRGVFGIPFGPKIMYFLLPGLGALLVLFLGLKTQSTWLGCAYGLILGGALGNLIDRLRLGYVIDFIDFELRSVHFRWFTFNLADAFVVLGVIMILLSEIGRSKKQGRAKSKEAEKNEATGISGQQFNNSD